MKNIFIIVSGFLSVLLSWFLLIPPKVLFKSNLDPFVPLIKNYSLTKQYDPFDLLPTQPLPTVQTRPGTNKYRTIKFKEFIDSLGTYDELFFASKRIAELQTWGNELDWKITLGQYNNHITNYWKKINKKDRQIKYQDFKNTLQGHYNTLEEIIFLQSEDQIMNVQKMQYIDKIFDQFKALDPGLIVPDSNLDYPIYKIVEDKEYGIYDISTQISNDYRYSGDIQLILNGERYRPKVLSAEDEDVKIVFNQVRIDDQTSRSNIISINIPETKVDVSSWTASINKLSPIPYSYELLINNLEPGDYRINFSHALKNPITLEIEERVASEESKLKYRNDKIYEQTIYPHGYKHTSDGLFQRLEANKKILGTYLSITSSKKLNGEELGTFNISFTPVVNLGKLTATKVSELPNFKPVVYSKKNSDLEYKITTVNLSKTQDKRLLKSLGFNWGWKIDDQTRYNNQSEYKTFYWLKYAIVFLPLFFIIFTFKYKAILYFLNFSVKYLWKILKYVCIKFQLILFLLFLSGLFIDFYILQGSKDIVLLSLTGLWIFVLVGYHLEAKINFFLALIFLIFCLILNFFHLDVLAEKSAIWIYMMLGVGTFQSIVETRFKIYDLIDYSVFLKKITGYSTIQLIIQSLIKVLLNFLNFIINIVINFISSFIFSIISVFNYLFKMLSRIINKRPRSIKDYSIIAVKISVIMTFLIMLVAIIITIPFIIGFTATKITIYYQKKIKIENLQKERKKLDPYIKIVEPKLAYKATNVIIYGENFGWDPKKARVMIDGKRFDPILWQNSKIIFPVPITWKNGIHKIWIEKEIDWMNKKEIAKSGIFEIKILPITDGFTKDDDLYFNQLKDLRKETLELNGYN